MEAELLKREEAKEIWESLNKTMELLSVYINQIKDLSTVMMNLVKIVGSIETRVEKLEKQ